jgi:hypothetical protein
MPRYSGATLAIGSTLTFTCATPSSSWSTWACPAQPATTSAAAMAMALSSRFTRIVNNPVHNQPATNPDGRGCDGAA